MKKHFTLFFLLLSSFAFSQSTTIVISQVYGGGGGTTGTYKRDFVELHNVSNTTQSLAGKSLQYGPATGNFGSVATNVFAFPANTSIPAGKYLLIQLSAAGQGGADLPVTPDIDTANLAMSASSGKVALVNQTTALGCGATATPCVLSPSVFVDVVSYGAANSAEGGKAVNNGAALVNTQGAVRKNNGCLDTDNNNGDFDVVTAPVPRNSASPASLCVSVTTPTLTTTPLSTFGSICAGTTSNANSFTLTGSNLSGEDVVVGPLTGYTFSTSANGTYTGSLAITPANGSVNQAIFVKLSPAAVQAYNGNIPVSGGGATAINVAVTGSGVNAAPTVTTAAAGAISSTGATLPGTISNSGCSAVTAYGIEYSNTAGFANGAGTPVAATNLAAGGFSVDLSNLQPGTTYYFKAFATNSGSTSYGAQQSFSTTSLSPTITASAPAAFGNVCIGTTTTPTSVTITGTNLTAEDITVASLAGYSFAATMNGSYSSSLTLTQGGGNYSQTIYVKFSPLAVQSYAGNITISGAGTTSPLTISTSGDGVNSAPSLTTGLASNVMTTTAILAGSLTAAGCTAVSETGFEYSTTQGFANGTGTKVVSGATTGNFSTVVNSLIASTTYYYKAYATNAGGTAYGIERSFTTAAPPPSILTATSLSSFGTICVGSNGQPQSFTISGTNLTAADVFVTGPAGYTFAAAATGPFSSTLAIPQTGGDFTKTVYVSFSPAASQSYTGNIIVSGGGATAAVTVPATGNGVNTPATLSTEAAANITTRSAVLSGKVTDNGCSAPTETGVEYSSINNFVTGSGTKVKATTSGSSFAVPVNGLVQGTVYYYRAYAINNGGVSYGAQQSFTVLSIPNSLAVYPSPVQRGSTLSFSLTSLKRGYYALVIYNQTGQKVYQKDMNIQAEFINDNLIIPRSFPAGIYRVELVNETQRFGTKSILIVE